jgi:hypothetical protein
MSIAPDKVAMFRKGPAGGSEGKLTMNKNNVLTEVEKKAQIRQRDIEFRDKLILHDGSVVQVVEAFDTMVKVSGYKRPYVYLYEVKAHYPYVAD